MSTALGGAEDNGTSSLDNKGGASMNYFGEPWPSGVCEEDGKQQDTPLGKKCFFCDEPIVEGDQGSFNFANPSISQCMDEDHVVYVFTDHPAFENSGYRTYAMNAVHRECSLREVIGGIGHLEDHFHWCKEMKDPDGGRTRRQSALEVWQWAKTHDSSKIEP